MEIVIAFGVFSSNLQKMRFKPFFSVGNLIATQSINRETHTQVFMENITDTYKYPEGTSKEREIYYKALKQVPTAQKFYEQFHETSQKDVTFTLERVKSLVFGNSFDVNLAIKVIRQGRWAWIYLLGNDRKPAKCRLVPGHTAYANGVVCPVPVYILNQSDETRKIEINLSATTVLYTRLFIDEIKQGQVQVEIKPKEMKHTKMQVSKEDYINKLLKTNCIKIAANCKVIETGQISNEDCFFEVMKINLTVEGPLHATLGSKTTITFSFTNPLSEELTNCFFNVEGAGLWRPKTYSIPNVPPSGVMRKEITLSPSRVGRCTLVGIFFSNQLTNVSGVLNMQIQP